MENKRITRALKASPLLTVTVAALLVGSGLAYMFYSSGIFTKQISVTAVFQGYCNFDPNDLTLTEWVWNLDELIILSDFSSGNKLYLITEKDTNVVDPPQIEIIIGGTYASSGGRVHLSAQRMQATWANEATPPYLATVNDPQGDPIIVNNLGTAGQFELPGLMNDLYPENALWIQYYELTFTFGNSLPFGNYGATLQIEITDGP